MGETTCDRCCARALETWESETTGRDIRLCRHHGREYELQLYAQGFRIVEAQKVPA